MKALKNIFRNVSEDTLKIIRTFNQEKKNTFLIPTKFISSEAGQVGLLLNEYFNRGRKDSDRAAYRSFFGNSRFEALQGAVKIARHKSVKRTNKTTLVYDSTSEFLKFADPLERGESKALIPGLKIVSDLKDAEKLLSTNPLAFIVCFDDGLTVERVSELFAQCEKQGIIAIFEHSDMDVEEDNDMPRLLSPMPDVIVTGESMTDYEIPYGAFSMKKKIHAPWATVVDCFVHSSTYAGNNLALTKVRNKILEGALEIKSDANIRERCRKIEVDNSERLSAFAEYINPGLVNLYGYTGLDVNVVKAEGSILTVKENDKVRDIFDCASGGGAVMRGHNPDDFISETLETYDPTKDYWGELSKKIGELSLPHSFPAISGATAVENALTMALLANKDKQKIIIFKGNYGGKTLLALTVSEDEEQTRKSVFHPFYHDVEYIDPFADDAEKILEAALRSGKVGLVWLELFQGGTTNAIPDNLVNMINKHKQEYGYIVGVDEIFMGLFRLEKMFTYKDKIDPPDIITLAKPLSDGVFPFAMTLVSSEVYQNAMSNNPDVTRRLENLCHNNFGSLVALRAIEKITSDEFQANAREVSEILSKGFKKLAENSPVLREIAGKGHIYHFRYAKNSFLKRALYDTLIIFMCRLLLKEANMFLFFDRFIPALTLTKEEANAMLDNLNRLLVTKKSLNFPFFKYALKTISNELYYEITKNKW